MESDELTFFRAVYETAGLGICVTDSKDCFLLVNDAFCRVFGYSREQLLGQPITMFIPSDLAGQDEHKLRDLLGGQGDPSYYWQASHRNGDLIKLFATAKLVEISNDRRFIVSTFMDVTRNSENEEALRKQQQEIERLSRIASQTINGVIITDKEGLVEWVNEGFTRISGFSLAQMKGQKPGTILQGAETNPETIRYMGQRLAMGTGFQVKVLNYHASSYAYWVEVDCSPLLDDQGNIQGYLALQVDITEQKRVARLLDEQNNLFQSIVETMHDGVITIDGGGSILSINEAAKTTFQYTSVEILGQNVKDLMPDRFAVKHDGYLEKYQRTGQGNIMGRSRELEGKRKDGSVFPLELSVTETVKNGEPLYVGLLRDITARKAYENQIEQLAFTDALTQLANRRLLEDRIDQYMAVTGRSGKRGALFFLDIDDFKVINDTLGHFMGDQLLIRVARTLKAIVYETDTVARMGGDEFIVVLADLPADILEAAKCAQRVATRIIDAVAQPFGNAEFQHNVSCSLGAVLFTGHDVSADELMRQSDIAMYNAKSTGKNRYLFFDPAMQSRLLSIHRTESELKAALNNAELEPYYQAQVDAQGALTGAEVLVRWNHPERGLLAPGEFIDIAESSGLIVPMGYQVFAMACARLAAWSKIESAAELTLAVNISARQFEEADFTTRITEILNDSGANPRLVKLEITESILATDIASVSAKMRELRALGIKFSLDDFGTGYSSLTYLKRLPITQLKIDQSFVRDLLVDQDDRAIANTIIALASTLGIDVIAEGVETDEHWALLLTMGCESFQGYFFGRPEGVEVFERRLQNGPATADL